LPLSNPFAGLFRKADPEPTTPAPVSLTDPLASWLFGAQPTYSNISVTPKTAMQVPAVALAVQTIANAVGGLPVKLYVRNGKGKDAAPAHPAFALAHDEANPWTSAAELRAQLTRDALLHDNGGFAFAVRGGSGNVVEFHRLDPLTVEIKTDEATSEPFYLVGKGQKRKRHEYWDILHVRQDDGAPINLARNAIALAIELERKAAGLFKNGARPSGILKHPGKLGDDAAKRLKAGWQASQSGSDGVRGGQVGEWRWPVPAWCARAHQRAIQSRNDPKSHSRNRLPLGRAAAEGHRTSDATLKAPAACGRWPCGDPWC
jgi:hypothetical protein